MRVDTTGTITPTTADLRSLPAHLGLLLEVLKNPKRCSALDPSDQDLLIRTARAAQLLGEVAVRVRRSGSTLVVSDPFGRQLLGALAQARHRAQMLRFEAACVAPPLETIGACPVLLKGAAYIAQSLGIAEGRLPRDLDLMVARDRLEATEQALQTEGWRFDEALDDYDQHYYRAWTHELPAMRFPGHAVEVDLHHAILPPIGRLRPDTALLLGAAIPIGGGYHVLCPADQVLHAAAHLFQDSDCVGRLRDLVDIDGLVREFSATSPAFWTSLRDRAQMLGLSRPLWYALTLCRRWLDTPIPEPAGSSLLSKIDPPFCARWPLLELAERMLPPVAPDSEPTARHRLYTTLLEFRALWLRMPPWTLAYHAIRKGQRAIAAWWNGLRASPE